MMNTLQGKVALITGASSGIGETTAIALAQEGAAVVLGARRSDEGERVAETIRATGGKAIFRQTDVTDDAQIAALVKTAEDEFGGLDIAFNNAGVEGALGPLVDADIGVYDHVFGTNVRGVWLSLRHEIPAMKRRGGGVIISTSSVFGSRGVAGFGTYAASKFAIEGLTKSVALEVASDNIRINLVAPGPIVTPMLERATGGNTDAFNGVVPMGRPGAPEEIASAVMFLASDGARYITGESLQISGGATAGIVTG